MGTASFDIVQYGRNNRNVAGELVTSGAFTTSTTASNLEDAGGDVLARRGDVLHIEADEAMRVVVGGGTATASVGYYVGAGFARDIEISDNGTISIIDVA